MASGSSKALGRALSMQVRSLTLGVPAGLSQKPDLEDLFARLGNLRDNLVAMDIPVETIRATFPPIIGQTKQDADEWEARVGSLANEVAAMGINYFSAPLWVDAISFVPAIARVVANTSQLFSNLNVLNPDGTISGNRIKTAAAIIRALGETDAFNNLRFCASARAVPNTPFFPASFHDPNRTRPALSIALEAADEVVKASQQFEADIEKNPDLGALVRTHMERAIEDVFEGIAEIGIANWVDFLGVDLSPAPFPEPRRSIGRALEIASGVEFGDPAILGIIAQIVAGLRQVDRPRWGFNGVMLPVLEDATIAKRTKEGKVTIETLLLYSSVCGTGLDTVPLPGDTCDADLQQLIYSIAVLATQLQKPLTARLMPIPGKNAGDATSFSFEYFANAAVMKVPRKTCVRLPGC